MSLPQALIVLAALVAATGALAIVLRARAGHGRAVSRATVVAASDLGSGEPLGEFATFVQLGTTFCAPCRATARRLSDFTATRPGVAHLDIDLAESPELADRFNVVETPTTLLLDRGGVVRVRFAGVPRPDDLEHHLHVITTGDNHDRS